MSDITTRHCMHALNLYQKFHGLDAQATDDKLKALYQEALELGCTEPFAWRLYVLTVLLAELDSQTDRKLLNIGVI